MKVAELLEKRRRHWMELEALCHQMQNRGKRSLGAAAVARFSTLYRAACADLALSDAYQMPPDTVRYLHQLVALAHNQMYRSRKFNFRAWAHEMIHVLPQRLFRDNCLRLAFVLFWGVFISSMVLAATSRQFAEEAVGKDMLMGMEEMYKQPVNQGRQDAGNQSTAMGGFYQWHNTTIGLKVFAAGLLFGVGGLFETVFNAGTLGAVFGHMLTTPQRDNFYHFVTAHGPFELTAIILSAAAGMRLGFSLIDTRGLSRKSSLAKAGYEAIPAASACMVLFLLAAIIEGFVSPSTLPYGLKAMVAAFSSLLMMFYFVLLGMRPMGESQLKDPMKQFQRTSPWDEPPATATA